MAAVVRFQQRGPVGAGIDLSWLLWSASDGPSARQFVAQMRSSRPTSKTFEGDDKRAVWMVRCLAARRRAADRSGPGVLLERFKPVASFRCRPSLERGPHPPGAATGISEVWPKVGRPHVAAACLNAGDWTIDAVSEKVPSGSPRIVASGAGGVDGGEVVGSGNVLRPCARMHSAIFIPCSMRVAEPPPGPPIPPGNSF